ncbi:MAG: tyrosyl-tRNA synthetase [Candidatus Berkelbacteria bacterium Licking1014_7]|uniref:Tyrosine--tRNA ligase n=1 Tax=Candidatus Berkelbacteria bacterium Licking1014_7 TaxID=2017147 RepID=A0A554LK06_9BACT|nr:MAG: tyrosyl-tRNA synthetase [Candidatus Berkelbacteria bacterium Licking1014_7]
MSKLTAKISDLLTRGVSEIIVKRDLEKQLLSGKKLRIKLGLDSNIPDLHLGHAVNLRKLRAFQDLGHQAILILGDYTAAIGDPSGQDKTRPAVDVCQTKKNAREFLRQAGKILDKNKTEAHCNSEWFSKMSFLDVLNLASKMTVKHILSHDTFRRRIKKDQPFFMHELMYPLMQGYDSVMVAADVELGASEQKFNLLSGRRLQRAFGQKEQNILMMRYLIGTDGKEKMSKTLGNFISLRDSASEMYGKIMSIPDVLMREYFELCADLEVGEIDKLMVSAKTEPKKVKERLAGEIVKMYYSEKDVQLAKQEFDNVFGAVSGAPSKIQEVGLGAKKIVLLGALVKTGLVLSRSEARRLVVQGGVKIDQQKVDDVNLIIDLSRPKILQVGKRKFVRIKS